MLRVKVTDLVLSWVTQKTLCLLASSGSEESLRTPTRARPAARDAAPGNMPALLQDVCALFPPSGCVASARRVFPA